MGLLPVIADDLGVSVPSAGLLVSYYAIGVVIGAPLFTIATSAVRRNTLLFGLIALFALGNLVCALAPTYSLLMAGRVLAAMSHGAFFGVGTVVAASLVAPERQASAIALMFGGLTLANIMGVPLGTLIGQAYGWRATFWLVTAGSVLVALALILCLPRMDQQGKTRVRQELQAFFNPQLPLALLITAFSFGGIFTLFTFIAPLLVEESNFSSTAISGILMLFGIGMTVGVAIGGKLADRWPTASSLCLPALLTVILAAFTVTGNSQVAVAANVFFLGLFGATIVPGLQMRVLNKAAQAPNLASSLNIGAFNVGNAGGAWLGSQILLYGFGFSGLALAGAILTLFALLVTAFSLALDRTERVKFVKVAETS